MGLIQHYAAILFHQALIPVLVIGVLICVHEFGHFLLAKLTGVGVLKFSIGFGPALFKVRRKETEYQLSAIPLGGYVRMVGDMPDLLTGKQATDETVREADTDEEKLQRIEYENQPSEVRRAIEDRARWFIHKNFWQRTSIVLAGPVFNYLLAIVVVIIASWIYGEERMDEAPKIGSVMAGSPAEKAGVKPGDIVHTIGGKETATWDDLAETVHRGTGEEIVLDVSRGSEKLTLTVQPQMKEVRGYTGEKKSAYFIGIGPSIYRSETGFVGATRFGLLWTLDKTVLTYVGLWGMLTGKVSPKDLAGPLFIIDTAGKQSREGFDSLLYFTALLSVSLAVLNLLPIPVLDGGHIMFFIVEALIGPISVRKKEFAQQVGMVLLLCLMVFAIRNDIFREPVKAGVDWQAEDAKPEGKQ